MRNRLHSQYAAIDSGAVNAMQWPSPTEWIGVAETDAAVLVRLSNCLRTALPALRFLPALANVARVTVKSPPSLYRLIHSVDQRLRVICGTPQGSFDLDLHESELPFALPCEPRFPEDRPLAIVRPPDETVLIYEREIGPVAAGRPRLAWLTTSAPPVMPGFSWHILRSAPRCKDWAEYAAWLDCMNFVVTSDCELAALAIALGKPTCRVHEAGELLHSATSADIPTCVAHEVMTATLRCWYNEYLDMLLA